MSSTKIFYILYGFTQVLTVLLAVPLPFIDPSIGVIEVLMFILLAPPVVLMCLGFTSFFVDPIREYLWRGK